MLKYLLVFVFHLNKKETCHSLVKIVACELRRVTLDSESRQETKKKGIYVRTYVEVRDKTELRRDYY